MSKKQGVTNTSHNVPYATQHKALNSQQKAILIDKVKSYQIKHPYSFHKLAKFMVGVSAMTLWRIANDKVQRLSNSTLYHLYRFFREQEPYSVFKTALRTDNWIRRGSKVKFY
jgi:predicted AAA+ superfamily ATPase